MTPRMFRQSSSGAGGLRESLRERFGRLLEAQEAPQRLPRGPRRPKGSPRRSKMNPRRPQMTPRRGKMSPRRAGESSGRFREASGSDLGRISEAFPSNARRPRRSLLKPPARARSARARLQAGAAARMFSQPSPGSSQKARNRNARETHETFQLQTPGERAQRASKGCTRPTTLAILMLAMLSPRWLRGASWCFALVLLAVLCASLLAARARAARDPPHSQS